MFSLSISVEEEKKKKDSNKIFPEGAPEKHSRLDLSQLSSSIKQYSQYTVSRK